MEETRDIESYIRFVQNTIDKYKDLGDLIRGNEVLPSKVNYALAQYYEISGMLNSEYQRAKMEHLDAERDFTAWYDKKFEIAKEEVIAEYASTKTKPAVKEYDIRVRTRYADEFKEWQIRVTHAEAQMRFILRMMDRMDRYDKILTTLSNNMRSEMMVLSIDKRANSSPLTNSQNRIRGDFPKPDDYLSRRAHRTPVDGSEEEPEDD